MTTTTPLIGSSLQIQQDAGNLNFYPNDAIFSLLAHSADITTTSNGFINIQANDGNIRVDSDRGDITVNSDLGRIIINSSGTASNAVSIFANNGGIYQSSGNGGITLITSNGDIDILSQGADINIGVSPVGTPANQQTQNVNIESFNQINMNSGDMYFVSSDVLSFVSNTGDIQFGTSSNGAPVLKFENGNVLINQNTSPLDYQLDVAITHESDSKPGTNGIMVNTKASNVAADITLQTSNGLGDGTQCIISMGAFGSDNKYAVYQVYLAYQTGNVVVRMDGPSYSPNSISNTFGKDFLYSDVGRQLYWPLSDRLETITDLGSLVSAPSASNITISGTYSGNTSRVYLLQIDSTGTPNTFKWSNNGGNTFEQIYVPIVAGPIALDNGLSVIFNATTGFTLNQQFTFQAKITAIVDNATSIPTPETMYSIQPFYAYIQTTTPSDIVIRTNATEKMRITGDGAIGVQNKVPTAQFDIGSNYGKVLAVNQTVSGYQLNPAIGNLESGGYVLVWNSQDTAGSIYNFNVVGQRYMADGSRFGYNFLVNSYTSNNQSFPTIAGNKLQNSNHYLVAWSSNHTGSSRIYCKIYHNNESITTNEIDVGTGAGVSTNTIQNFPRAAGLANGNYVVVWAEDTNATGTYAVYAAIISDEGAIVQTRIQFSYNDPPPIYSRSYPYVAGLAADDDNLPGGFVCAYMKAVDLTVDPRYTIVLRTANSNCTAVSQEIPITETGSNAYSSISDGLLSVAEINNHLVNQPNGGFVMSFYRNYLADATLYNVGDPVSGDISGATANILDLYPAERTIKLQNISNRFLEEEQITIVSSNIAVGNIIEKIQAITFLSNTTANIVLDNGSKNVVAYRFNSNLTSANDALWNFQVNTSPLYTDQDRFTGNSSIYTYKRPLAAISVDNEGTGIVSWSNGTIPSVYYQLFDSNTGAYIGTEQRLTTQYEGLKQRDQVVTHLQSIQGNDYGFVVSWDNQSLDLSDTGIYQQLIGHNHSLLNIADGSSNLVFNHQNQMGIGITEPSSILHLKTQIAGSNDDPANPSIITLQNTSQHIITNEALQGITCLDGSGNVLNNIQSVNSLRYDDLYPQPTNLKGFYKFDHSQGSQVVDYSSSSTFLDSADQPVYINTNGILYNFDLENCWQTGLINNSLLFDGIDNYVQVNNDALNDLNTIIETTPHQMTLSCWVNVPSNVVVNSRYDIVSNGGNLTTPGTYILGLRDIASNGVMCAVSNVIVNGPANISAIGTKRINDSSWHHILETVDVAGPNTLINLYVDGVLDSSANVAGVVSSVQHATINTYIGSTNGGSNFFRGYMDELRFYDSVLTTAEIQQLYTYGNPNIAPKSSLVLKPNNNTYNQAIVIDDDGKINNFSCRPLPYSVLTGELVASSSNASVSGEGTRFIDELTVGDIIVLGVNQDQEYTITAIESNTNITIDRVGYAGPEATKPYQSVLRKPSITTYFDNGDNIVGHIDNYGNVMIGPSKPTHMLTISGESGNTKSIPEITIVNSSVENSSFGRTTAVNFQGYNVAQPLADPVSLGRIETAHYGTGSDTKGIMRLSVNDGVQLNTLVSLTSNGNIGIGGGTSGQNNPLTLIHATTLSQSNECAFLMESNYYNDSTGAASSVFDERSNIYFTGLDSITDSASTNVRFRTLAAVSGSNDGNSRDLVGRLDFATNGDSITTTKNGIENRMSITNDGKVGIGIMQPANFVNIAPDRRIPANTICTISSTASGGTVITLSENIFSGYTAEQLAMYAGGSAVVGNATLTRANIVSATAPNTITVSSDLSAFTGKQIYVHMPGFNYVKSTGYTGINTRSPGSLLSINGSLSLPIVSTSSDLTLNGLNYTVLADTTSNNITITLPTNSSSIAGRIYVVKKKAGANTLTVGRNGANIDGSASDITVSTYSMLQSDGTDWWVIG